VSAASAKISAPSAIAAARALFLTGIDHTRRSAEMPELLYIRIDSRGRYTFAFHSPPNRFERYYALRGNCYTESFSIFAYWAIAWSRFVPYFD
jgi:hypothetical protein